MRPKNPTDPTRPDVVDQDYRALFDLNLLGVFITQPDGRIIDANPAACAMLGMTRDEICAAGREGVVEPNPRLSAALAERDQTGKAAAELTLIRKDGSRFPVMANSVVSSGSVDGRRSFVVVEDISARKEMEESLLRTQFIVDHSHDLIHWMGPDGRFLYVNDASCRRLGYSREELLGMTVSDIDPLAPRGWAGHFEEVKARGSVTFESTHRTKSGETYPVEVTANYVGYGGREQICSFVRDISERRQAEEAAARSRELLTNLARLVPGVIYQYRLYPDGSSAFPYSSPGMNDIYEVTPEEVWEDATPVFGRLHPDDYHYVAASIQESARTLQTFYCEFRVVLPRQGLRWRWSQAHPERTADGGTLWHGIISDITERKQAEEALRRSEQQLRASQKMEAVGQLAGGMAHDFNNLLAAILGYSDLLLAGGGLSDATAREDVEEIKRAAERGSALTKRVLAFSRRQPLSPVAVSLGGIIAGLEALLRRTLGEDVDLVCIRRPGPDTVEADVNQFEQVIMNLAVNARDAMASGGRLTFETGGVELDEEFCQTHPGVIPGSYAMLSVSDTGAGMDEAVLARVFEPFFTTKSLGEGTGLGLAMVYGIVKQSQGSIFVESEPGKGTIVKIYLPRTAAPAEEGSQVTPGRAPTAGHETILVVEDEAALRRLVVRVLGGLGYRVFAAGTATEALRVAVEADDSLDLLLTDVVLPGVMQGDELARRLLASRPDLPVLYMSGYINNAFVHDGRLDEGVSLLEKPFSSAALAGMVRSALDRPRRSA